MPYTPGKLHRALCDYIPRGDYAGRGVCTLGEDGRCAEFRSFAAASVIPDQLRAAGWHIMQKGIYPGTFRDVKHLGKPELVFTFCPAHRPVSSVMQLSESRT